MAHRAAQPQVIIEQSAAGPVRTGSTGQRLSPWPRLAPAARRQAVIPDRGPRRIAPVVSTCPCPAALAQAPNDATPRLPGRSSAAWPRMRSRDARRRAGKTRSGNASGPFRPEAKYWRRPPAPLHAWPARQYRLRRRGNDLSFRPGQPLTVGSLGHRRRSGPATSGVCARGAAGPAAVLAAHRADARRGPVPGGQGASRWLLPGGQRGPSAAARRVRGGRIEVIVAWRRARRLGRLCRRHQPPPGDAGQMPRCPGLAPSRIRRWCAHRVPVDARDRVRAGCDTRPGT